MDYEIKIESGKYALKVPAKGKDASGNPIYGMSTHGVYQTRVEAEAALKELRGESPEAPEEVVGTESTESCPAIGENEVVGPQDYDSSEEAGPEAIEE